MSKNFPSRRSTRLKGYDYSQNGAYFVTICTHDREKIFGDIVNGEMKLNERGKIVHDIWKSLPDRFRIVFDAFQIMPNHIHMIIQTVGAIHESPDKFGDISDVKRAHRDAPLHRSLLSNIVGYFKMNTSKTIHIVNSNISVWQRNYYEHIIRDENDLNRIREYIIDNPTNWPNDEMYS